MTRTHVAPSARVERRRLPLMVVTAMLAFLAGCIGSCDMSPHPEDALNVYTGLKDSQGDVTADLARTQFDDASVRCHRFEAVEEVGTPCIGADGKAGTRTLDSHLAQIFDIYWEACCVELVPR